MGRLRQALTWLAGQDAPETLWALALLEERPADRSPPGLPLTCFFLDQAEACLSSLEPDLTPMAAILQHWAQIRSGQAASEAQVQAALARLRREAPSHEARGLAIHATAAFQQHPVHALPHLDQALAQCARFGLHFLDVRLYDLKARALDAAGLLRDADRFRRASMDALQRQRGD